MRRTEKSGSLTLFFPPLSSTTVAWPRKEDHLPEEVTGPGVAVDTEAGEVEEVVGEQPQAQAQERERGA